MAILSGRSRRWRPDARTAQSPSSIGVLLGCSLHPRSKEDGHHEQHARVIWACDEWAGQHLPSCYAASVPESKRAHLDEGADRWVSMPNGARMSHGWGRASVEAG